MMYPTRVLVAMSMSETRFPKSWEAYAYAPSGWIAMNSALPAPTSNVFTTVLVAVSITCATEEFW